MNPEGTPPPKKKCKLIRSRSVNSSSGTFHFTYYSQAVLNHFWCQKSSCIQKSIHVHQHLVMTQPWRAWLRQKSLIQHSGLVLDPSSSSSHAPTRLVQRWGWHGETCPRWHNRTVVTHQHHSPMPDLLQKLRARDLHLKQRLMRDESYYHSSGAFLMLIRKNTTWCHFY